MTFAEFFVIALVLGVIYLALQPVRRKIERTLMNWLSDRAKQRRNARIIDITPLKKRPFQDRDSDYEK